MEATEIFMGSWNPKKGNQVSITTSFGMQTRLEGQEVSQGSPEQRKTELTVYDKE